MGIEFTFDPQRHLYLVHGRPVPSVTQVLHAAGLSADYSLVDAETLERKRVIGDYVHKATQYLDEGCLDYGSVDPKLRGYLTAYEAFVGDSGFNPQLIEQRLVGRVSGMLCGGTVDRVGTMAGKLWIIDLKCIDRLYPSFAIQTAGYELLLPKPVVPPFRYTRAVLQLKHDGSYKLSPPYEDPVDFDVFRAALVVTVWKIHRGCVIETGAWSEVDEATLAEAAAREAEGDHETAELILEHAVEQTETLPEPEPHVPVVLVAPLVQASTPKVRGVGFRDVPKWRMQCGHERADAPNCATCRCVPREYLVLDPKRVQARINGFGVNANIPGIEVWTECQASFRRKL